MSLINDALKRAKQAPPRNAPNALPPLQPVAEESSPIFMWLVLAVIRLEVLIMCALAGLAIGGSGLGMAANWLAAAVFVAVAAFTVAIPVLAYAGAGDRLDDPMARLKDWMERNNAALLAAILLVIGLMVLHNGVKAL